jgi:hypothetical protein
MAALAWQNEKKKMPFMTTPERIGYIRGLLKVIGPYLELKFGEEGLKLVPEIDQIHEVEKLERVLEAMKTAASPEELRRLWAS